MTDQERDAHLREALRHAPDAQVQPPPSLSALILSEARAKARDTTAPAKPARHPLLALWDWFARPSVAAGFAGLMVATLVGVMWWDQPMNEALPQRPAPAAAPAETAPSVATPPVAPPAASAPEAAPRQAPAAEAERRAPEPPSAALRKSAPTADKAAVAPAKPAAPSPSPAPPAPAARNEVAADAKADAAPPVPESASITALSLPPPVVPAPAATQAAPAGAITGATAGGLAASKSADESESKRARSVATRAMRSDAAPQAELSERRVQQEVARTSLVRLRAAIAADPMHWTWQRGDDSAQGMNDAIYAWLAQLDSATGSRWQPRAARETGALLGRELRLLRDGRLEHSLRLTEHGVLWEQAQSAWQAELPAATITPLQSALDTAAP
jgi:hypothetical protein